MTLRGCGRANKFLSIPLHTLNNYFYQHQIFEWRNHLFFPFTHFFDVTATWFSLEKNMNNLSCRSHSCINKKDTKVEGQLAYDTYNSRVVCIMHWLLDRSSSSFPYPLVIAVTVVTKNFCIKAIRFDTNSPLIDNTLDISQVTSQ